MTMKAVIIFLVSLACFLCLFSDLVQSAPAPSDDDGRNFTFWDKIFNIPRSVLKSTGNHLNKNGVQCKDGQFPVEGPDGKGTCHDNGGLHIARSAIDSVNDFLNG